MSTLCVYFYKNPGILSFKRQVPYMKKNVLPFFKNFLKCGLAGWCMEILFTALCSLRRRDFTLKGITSLWMFPIYGCAAIIAPLSRLLKDKNIFARGLLYMSLIFSTEYLSGRLLFKKNFCPWDYRKSRFHINRVIRLDYAPCWFFAGLFFEKFLRPHQENALQ